MEIITGERIQEMCDIYIGTPEVFSFNPVINNQNQNHKCLCISNITSLWDNPRIIFCYGHVLKQFSQILSYIQNDFILVSHNSDQNITSEFYDILEHPKLLFWHAQNVLIEHPKLGGIPIGIANSMWGHGDINALQRVMKSSDGIKENNFYFYFNVWTNPAARYQCKDELEKKGLVFGNIESNFEAYLQKLSTFKYAICPPGNGIDSHRIWEAIYLGVIPICIRSKFTELVNMRFPLILLDNWSEFDASVYLNNYVLPSYTLRISDIHLHNDSPYFRA